MKALRSICVVCLVAAGLFLGGCRSTWDFWKEDTVNVMKATNNRLNHVHWSLDRHFLNYDWDDPYLDDSSILHH